jgi:type IV secretory pathway TraG/TraD family ATPase VirD4
MAEQRPYRIAGTGNDRLWRIKAGVMLGLVTGFIVVNWIATQRAARLCGYAAGLGPPMTELPLFGPLYPPWQWIAWWWRWRNAPELAVLWAVCTRLAVYPMFGITALAVAAVGVARQGWFGAVSDLHGSARWATTRDIRDAGLIERRRLVPRRVRRFYRAARNSQGTAAAGRRVSGNLAPLATRLVSAALRGRPRTDLRADP